MAVTGHLSWGSLDIILRGSTDFLTAASSNHVLPLYMYFAEQANVCLKLKLNFSSFHFHFPPVLN